MATPATDGRRKPRLPEEKRTAIFADLKAGEKTKAQIALDHEVSPGTVTRMQEELEAVAKAERRKANGNGHSNGHALQPVPEPVGRTVPFEEFQTVLKQRDALKAALRAFID